MRSRLGRVALIVILVAATAACGSVVAGGGGGTGQLSARIQLSRTQVLGSQQLSGELVISNPGDTINLSPQGCRPQFAVVLTNSEFPPDAPWPAICVAGPFLIPRGTTRLPVRISTTYSECVQPGGSASGFPACSGSGPPPLPQGVYKAILVWNTRVPPMPAPSPVAVAVLANSS